MITVNKNGNNNNVFKKIFLHESNFLMKVTGKDNKDYYFIQLGGNLGFWTRGTLVDYGTISKSTNKPYYAVTINRNWDYELVEFLNETNGNLKIYKKEEKAPRKVSAEQLISLFFNR